MPTKEYEPVNKGVVVTGEDRQLLMLGIVAQEEDVETPTITE